MLVLSEPRTGRGLRLVVVGAAVVLAVIVITIVTNQDRPTASEPVPVAVPPGSNVLITPTYDPATTTTVTSPSPLSAKEELARQVAAVRADVAILAGIPQSEGRYPDGQ
jgi:hypothetical protein